MKPDIRWDDAASRWEVWIGGKLVSVHSSYEDAIAVHRPKAPSQAETKP